LRKLQLLAALLAMVGVLLIGASGPAVADDPWDIADDDSWGWFEPDHDGGWDIPSWIGGDDGSDVEWGYEPGYGLYPEELSWENDGYAYELGFVPCGSDDLCVDDFDRDRL